MAANPISVLNTLYAVQYDGTNSGDIIALDPGFDFNNASEAAGVWSFQSPPDSTSFTINTGDWILFSQNQVMYKWSNAEFLIQYSCTPTCETVESIQGDVETVQTDLSELSNSVDDIMAGGAQVRSIGVAPVPTLLLSGSANVDVTLKPIMPSTDFTPYANKFAGVSIVDLQINSVTIIDEDTVRVNVSNVGLATITGASVMVHAVA